MVAETGLPPGWEPLFSKSQERPYYYKDRVAGAKWESLWVPPVGTDEKKLDRYINQIIEASHLLVKHRESRRASSWRQEDITRSKEEARAILERHREAILKGSVSLPELAKTESDCSSAGKAGYLGKFRFGQMQMPFWKASVGLEKNGVSDIVETASGLHLIQRWNEDPPEETDDAKTEPSLPATS